MSTEEQADSRLGIDAQEAAVRAEFAARGWEAVEVIVDAGYSGKNLKRPGMQRALGLLKEGQADVLVAAKQDRLSRDVLDFGWLLKLSEREGWALRALDLDVDTTTANGRFVAHIMVGVAQHEREATGERTKVALAQAQARGVRLGRPREVSSVVEARVRALRGQGASYAAVAATLEAEGHRPPRGKQWWPNALRRIAERGAEVTS